MIIEYTLKKNHDGFEKSPIREFHPKWQEMNLNRKRDYLIATGQAANHSEASSLLAKHRGVVMRNRKHRDYLRSLRKNKAKN
jgi:hypothetical protein